MSKDNLPLTLLNRHREELGLVNPVLFENDNQLFDAPKTPIASAVIFLPKSKPLINMTLALVSGMVAEDGVIVLVGANDAGIRSANEAYEKYVGPVEQKIVGNHSAMYVGKNKKLGAGKTWRDFLSFSPLIYKELKLEVANVPGVFSAGSLDEGTKLLLDTIPYDRAKILDVGSGAGVIGSIYKMKAPKSDVTMSDASVLAMNATEETLKKNNLNAKVVRSDVFADISGTFDLILCNPPFHTGIQTDYSFIEKFACGAKKHLNPKGEVYVVANSFLAYQDKLERGVGPTEIIVDTGKFRVYKIIL